jgi:peptidyl-prolyl cis-trans isomerase SurA
MENTGILKTICTVGTIVFISCAGSNQTSDKSVPDSEVVGTVNGEQITYNELKKNFSQGNPSGEESLEELESFLPVYLDYRAKIETARDAGYYDNESVLNEYDVYSKQAAYAYWLEEKIRPTLFNEFKSRYDKEMKSSHVLIAVDQNASPEDTLEAYNKLMQAREEFLNGASMDSLDAAYSSTRGNRSMGGELPWFSVGTTVKEFEDVLYSLEVGEISMPFRTQFGYHIVLLEDVRDRKPSRYVSHIFVRKNMKYRIDTAYVKLQEGREWNEAVKLYTQDTPSANNGGLIGWINYGTQYDPAFIDSVMNLDPTEPFSAPFESNYGYHILKIDSVRTFANEADRDAFLMTILEGSNNFRKSNGFVTTWLDNTYGKENTLTMKEMVDFMTSIDSTLIDDAELPEDLQNKEIYTFGDDVYTAQDYMDHLKITNKGPFTENIRKAWFRDFMTTKIDKHLVDFTLKQFPEFSDQTDSYLNGLVVYQINEDSVWSAATVDTTKLMDLYKSDPEEYTFDTRYWYHLITSRQDSNIQKAIDFVNAGNAPDSIRKEGIPVGVSTDSTGAFSGEPFDILPRMEPGTFSNIFDYNNRKGVFYLHDVLPARKMTFEEAFNRLLGDYQPVRENAWLERMRSTYNVETYPEKLKEAYAKEHPME